MKAYSVEVRLSKQEDGLWRAEVPALPGCFVDGETVTRVLTDIQEVAAMAIDLFLEEGRLSDEIRETQPLGMVLELPVLLDEHHFRRRKARRAKQKSPGLAWSRGNSNDA